MLTYSSICLLISQDAPDTQEALDAASTVEAHSPDLDLQAALARAVKAGRRALPTVLTGKPTKVGAA